MENDTASNDGGRFLGGGGGGGGLQFSSDFEETGTIDGSSAYPQS